MSQIILDSADINTFLKKFVGPQCRFENGQIKLDISGADITLSDTVLSTKAKVNYQGLSLEASQASFDASGAKIAFGIKG